MSDELSIQQQKSGTPYVLGGAVVGGAAGYGMGVHGPKWATAPAKYSSYDDILKESADEFSKSMDGVEEDLKTKAENARKAFNEAGSKYDQDLQKYINENSKVLPADDELVKTMKEKEQALSAKREELIKQEADKLRKAQPAAADAPKPVLSERAADAAEKVKKEITAETKRLETITKSLNDASKAAADDLYKALDNLETLKASKAPSADIKAAQAEITKMEKALNEAITKVVDGYDFSGTKSEVKKAKAAKVKEIRAYIDDIIAERTHNESVHKVNIAGLADSRKKALENLDSVLGKDFSKAYTTNKEQFGKQLERNIKAENMRLNKLNEFKALYEKAVTETGNKTKVIEEVKSLFGLVTKTTKTTEVTSIFDEFAKSLTESQADDFLRLVGGDLDDKAITDAINKSKEKIKVMETSSQELNRVAAEIQKLGGEGAYIKKGVLYSKTGKKVEFTTNQIQLTSGELSVPKSKKLSALEKQLAKIEGGAKPAAAGDVVRMTEEQILEKAKANITDDMVKAEKEALEAAKKAVEEKTATLSPKTKEQLTKEFIEKNGSKDDFIKKAADSFKDDLKKLYEGKVSNGKLAAIIASGVVVGALVGSMLKPKKNA